MIKQHKTIVYLILLIIMLCAIFIGVILNMPSSKSTIANTKSSSTQSSVSKNSTMASSSVSSTNNTVVTPQSTTAVTSNTNNTTTTNTQTTQSTTTQSQPSPTTSNNTGVIVGHRADLHTEPNSHSQVIIRDMTVGTTITILGQTNDYLYISYNGQTGYVYRGWVHEN